MSSGVGSITASRVVVSVATPSFVSGSGSRNPDPGSGFHRARKAPRRPRATFLKVWLALAWAGNGERRPEGGHGLAERVGHVEPARDGALGVAVVEGAKGQRRPLLRVGDVAGNVHVDERLDGRARVIVGRLRAPLELHGVDPEDAPVALRGLEVKPDGHEQERLRRRERELIPLPVGPDADLPLLKALGRLADGQLRHGAVRLGAEVGREGERRRPA